MDSKEMIEDLRAALAELESGEGLGRFVEGHGLQSRFFAFSWETEGLSIKFRLPYARVLSDEDDQHLDAARVGAALRMARYSIFGPNGETIDAGDEWDPLVARLDAALPDGDDFQIIWP